MPGANGTTEAPLRAGRNRSGGLQNTATVFPSRDLEGQVGGDLV